jgi:ACS family hexuronate transporter-like MFS transporter
VTAFQAAFALGYLGFGWLIDRYGTKWGYAIAIALWSVAAMAHGWARSVTQFALARAALGLGEGGNTPAAIKAFTEYFPARERAFATGLFTAGSSLGAVLAPLVVPALALTWGWPAAFFVTGGLGLLWIVAWWRLYERPERQSRLSAAEWQYIQDGQEPALTERVGWLTLFRYRATWAFVGAKFLTDPVFWFYLYWLPKFLAKQYGLNITSSVGPLVVIYTIVAIGGTAGGYLSSALLRRGWSVNRGRKAVLLLSALLVLPIVGAGYTSQLWVAVGLIALAAAAHQSWSAVLFTTATDVFPKRAVATIVGIGGTAGAIGGMLVATATGYLLDATGSYLPVLALAGSMYLLALGLYHALVPDLDRDRVRL